MDGEEGSRSRSRASSDSSGSRVEKSSSINVLARGAQERVKRGKELSWVQGCEGEVFPLDGGDAKKLTFDDEALKANVLLDTAGREVELFVGAPDLAAYRAYMGNYGPDLAHVYRRALLVIEPQGHTLSQRVAAMGFGEAMALLEAMKSKLSAGDCGAQDCHEAVATLARRAIAGKQELVWVLRLVCAAGGERLACVANAILQNTQVSNFVQVRADDLILAVSTFGWETLEEGCRECLRAACHGAVRRGEATFACQQFFKAFADLRQEAPQTVLQLTQALLECLPASFAPSDGGSAELDFEIALRAVGDTKAGECVDRWAGEALKHFWGGYDACKAIVRAVSKHGTLSKVVPAVAESLGDKCADIITAAAACDGAPRLEASLQDRDALAVRSFLEALEGRMKATREATTCRHELSSLPAKRYRAAMLRGFEALARHDGAAGSRAETTLSTFRDAGDIPLLREMLNGQDKVDKLRRQVAELLLDLLAQAPGSKPMSLAVETAEHCHDRIPLSFLRGCKEEEVVCECPSYDEARELERELSGLETGLEFSIVQDESDALRHTVCTSTAYKVVARKTLEWLKVQGVLPQTQTWAVPLAASHCEEFVPTSFLQGEKRWYDTEARSLFASIKDARKAVVTLKRKDYSGLEFGAGGRGNRAFVSVKKTPVWVLKELRSAWTREVAHLKEIARA
ncbi:unnamed protein product [Pedinophyceae sp. YPF-701]|nr:unnamed protein product [Pedinophyceae sp. YPF-701]